MSSESEATKALLELGRARGYVTFDAINDALPPDLTAFDEIEHILALLLRNSIAVVETELPGDANDRQAEGPLSCTFCRRTKDDVYALVAGPDAYICDGCVERCEDIFRKLRQREKGTPVKGDETESASAGPVQHCSFCGKARHEVLDLVAGVEVFICDECSDLCADIVAKRRDRQRDGSTEA